ncbi:MAG: ABC transporter permease [Planctomycetota bacterium]|nr:MAG: ABC transporter permease [Planctomycetota bacterium]
MRNVTAILRRELAGYFFTPVAYVFLVIFLWLAGWFTLFLGQLYERRQADLEPFFTFVPWLYLFLLPAIAMRLWSEERRNGTIELLMTLPVSIGQAVTGKFLAAWLFAGCALVLTLPLVITVNYLGDPDNGVILAGYLGAFLMAGGYLAIGACISSVTKNQVIAFVLAVVACLLLMLAGFKPVMDLVPERWAIVTEALAAIGLLTHFESISKGVVDLRDVLYFLTLIAFCLFANAVILEQKKAD